MRNTAPIVALVVAALVTACAGPRTDTKQATQQTHQAADLVVVNAKVATMDQTRANASAFAVKDGKFVAVGSDADMDAYRGTGTPVVDAKGHTVIPGINDSHSHAIRGGRF